MNERDLVDEARLRRALRFEADEVVPRFDAAAIAALATREARPPARTLAIAIGTAVVSGVVASGVWSAILAAAPDLGENVVATLLDSVVAVATLAMPIAELASQPAVPISLLAALALAILHERRERAHVHAS